MQEGADLNWWQWLLSIIGIFFVVILIIRYISFRNNDQSETFTSRFLKNLNCFKKSP